MKNAQQRFLDIFQTQLPLIQAPMAGVQDHRLAVAVCHAGGLGSLPAAMLSLEALKAELAQLSTQTNQPYNVNFFCHTPPIFNELREVQWRAALKPYYDALGLDAKNIPAGAGRAPFTHAAADVLEAFKPPVVSFHFGLPATDLIVRVRSWGSKIIASATTVDEALWLESLGVDAVIAQGLEAGGHRGHFLSDDLTKQLGTFALLPQVVRALKVPVIAAGGIADAAGVAAAFDLGASAVQIGTAYMLCAEATTSALHRAALKSPAAAHTALTPLFTGRPARGIVNRLMLELGAMSDASPEFPLATGAIAPLRAAAEKIGSSDFSPLWSGQNVSGCCEMGAAALTANLMPANLMPANLPPLTRKLGVQGA
jgi:nitronate monooxygenase